MWVCGGAGKKTVRHGDNKFNITAAAGGWKLISRPFFLLYLFIWKNNQIKLIYTFLFCSNNLFSVNLFFLNKISYFIGLNPKNDLFKKKQPLILISIGTDVNLYPIVLLDASPYWTDLKGTLRVTTLSTRNETQALKGIEHFYSNTDQYNILKQQIKLNYLEIWWGV